MNITKKMDTSLLIEEEKGACDTPLSARIHTVQLPPDGQAEAEREALHVHSRYAHVFANSEEATYFSMLPLDAAARETVLKRALEIQRESREAEALWPQKCSMK